ncbi:lytic transglycosylase domain-containing protein [Metapseudomonas otitidis]|uniref:lytic transglycosylase domain-containing protein n=1 Tax=Metapseudomonas otitidis TaxID=319939 RepID=UPI000D1AD74F|nr:lytic transglycosylase domain-containing protein [Pseudomonas otitidis]
MYPLKAICLAVLAAVVTPAALAMDRGEFNELSARCAPSVAPETMAAIVGTESSFNPFAIGVVGGALERQPRSLEEARATAEALAADGQKFSVGIGQVYFGNLAPLGLDYTSAFDPCRSLQASSSIIRDCYNRAIKEQIAPGQPALHAAFSCYYSNNFTTGFEAAPGEKSYVDKVLFAAAEQQGTPVAVPAVQPIRFIPTGQAPAPSSSFVASTSEAAESSMPSAAQRKLDSKLVIGRDQLPPELVR